MSIDPARVKESVWINGKIVKIHPVEGGQKWRLHAGLSYHYIISVSDDVIRGREVSVEDVLRVFCYPSNRRQRNPTYIAVEYELQKKQEN